jgi:hypothetical protein
VATAVSDAPAGPSGPGARTGGPNTPRTGGGGPNSGADGAERLRRSRRRTPWYVFLPPAILALSLIATEVAQIALTKAVKKVPFEVRLPTELPSDAPLVRTFLDEPDSEQGFQAYQLNTWYRTPGDVADGGGRTIHVWQSNDKFLARRLRDPLQLAGTPETIAAQTWVERSRRTRSASTTASR